jgi:hypothetical protein
MAPGSWVVVTGSSNALLMWNTLLMMLAPSEAGDQRTGRFGGAHLLDAVIEDGVIIHYATATVLKRRLMDLMVMNFTIPDIG